MILRLFWRPESIFKTWSGLGLVCLILSLKSELVIFCWFVEAYSKPPWHDAVPALPGPQAAESAQHAVHHASSRDDPVSARSSQQRKQPAEHSWCRGEHAVWVECCRPAQSSADAAEILHAAELSVHRGLREHLSETHSQQNNFSERICQITTNIFLNLIIKYNPRV